MADAENNLGPAYPLPEQGEGFMSEAKSNPIREKSFEFALEVVRLCQSLNRKREYVISKQLMRSGTAIGAMVEESVAAESRRDFLHKMSIALKEAREVHYWLRLLDASGLVPGFDVTQQLSAADELVSLLTAITRTVKES
jgi:four helix bundle protein